MRSPRVLVLALTLALFVGCDDPSGEKRRGEEARAAAWNGPCADTSWLLATTTGSPDTATCPNKMHRMRAQVATTASNEEIGALVICECRRDTDVEDGGHDAR